MVERSVNAVLWTGSPGAKSGFWLLLVFTFRILRKYALPLSHSFGVRKALPFRLRWATRLELRSGYVYASVGVSSQDRGSVCVPSSELSARTRLRSRSVCSVWCPSLPNSCATRLGL